MQLRHLETFVAITEEGTLTAAAQRLKKSQSAVSHDLSTLESVYGVKLIDRTGQKVKLTQAGETLLPLARELVHGAENVGVMLENARRRALANVVRIGTVSSLAEPVLESALAFRESNPEATFIFYSEVRGMQIEWLRDGALDMAIAEPGPEADLEARVIGRDDLVVVLAADDPLGERTRLSPEELTSRPFISFARELGASHLATRFFLTVAAYPPPVMELNDAPLMKSLIRRGVGYGLMSRSAVRDEPGLTTVLPNPELHRDIAILRPRGAEVRPLHAKFEDHVSEALRPHMQDA